MLSDILSNKSSKELELACKKLQGLVDQQHKDLEEKQKQISHLSNEVSKWVKKYQEYEDVGSAKAIEQMEATLKSERKRMKSTLKRIRRVNAALVSRMEKLQQEVDRGNAIASSTRKPEEKSSDRQAQTNNAVEDKEIDELELSPEQQEQWGKHIGS